MRYGILSILFILCIGATAQKFQDREPSYYLSFDLKAGPYYSSAKATSDILGPIFTNDKKVESYYEVGVQFQLNAGPLVSLHRNVTKVNLDKEKVKADYIGMSPSYTVQPDAKTPHFYLDYYQLGLGWCQKINNLNALASTISFDYGVYKLRSGELAYREFGTNQFFIRKFNSEKNRTSGYSIDLNYRRFSKPGLEPTRAKGFIGLGLEYSHLRASGQGSFTDTRWNQQDITTSYTFDKKFNLIYFYLTLGLSLDYPDMSKRILK